MSPIQEQQDQELGQQEQPKQQRACLARRHMRTVLEVALRAVIVCLGTLLALEATSTTCKLRPLVLHAEAAEADAQASDAAQRCPVRYSSLSATALEAAGRGSNGSTGNGSALPLLMGGVHDRCLSGCTARTGNKWSDACRFDPTSKTTWGLCESWQRPEMLALASRVGGGAPLQFSPCEFHGMLRSRTLWLIGDSHMKNLYWAMRCFFLDFWDTEAGECAAVPSADGQHDLHAAALYTPRHKSLDEITEPRCIHLIAGGRICFLHVVRGENVVSGDAAAPGVLELLRDGLASPDDVFYVTFGRWFVHNCRKFEASAFNASLTRLADYHEANRARWPNVLFAVPPFDHSPCDTGFNAATATGCPAAGEGSSIEVSDQVGQFAHAALDGAMPVIDFYNLTLALQRSHVSKARSFQGKWDCLHFCRPGLPEIELWHLYDAMRRLGLRKVSNAAAAQALDAECRPIKAIY